MPPATQGIDSPATQGQVEWMMKTDTSFPQSLDEFGSLQGDHLSGHVFPATVFVSSVLGYTRACAEREPKDIATRTNTFYFKLTECVLGSGGVPVKYLGDGMLAFFAGEGHALRALEAARRTPEVVAESICVGLAEGDIHLTAMGHPDYARPDLIGSPVNLAFRVVGWAYGVTNGVAATRGVIEAAGSTVPTDYSTVKVKLKGFPEPVGLTEVLTD